MKLAKISKQLSKVSLLLFSIITLLAATQVEAQTYMEKRMLQDDPTFVVSDSKIEKGGTGRYTVSGKIKNDGLSPQNPPPLQLVLKTFEGDIYMLVVIPSALYRRSQKQIAAGQVADINLKDYLYTHNSLEQGAAVFQLRAVKTKD
jgi:hypothetical protein